MIEQIVDVIERRAAARFETLPCSGKWGLEHTQESARLSHPSERLPGMSTGRQPSRGVTYSTYNDVEY